MIAPNDNNLFTPEILAVFWGCSAQHVRNLIKRGELESFRIGPKLIRIRGEAVEAYTARMTRSTRPEPIGVTAVMRLKKSQEIIAGVRWTRAARKMAEASMRRR